MSIATGLIAKLLLAISVIPAAGYGGYCVYDHYNPTFHNQLIQQGFLFSPISGDMGTGEDIGKRRDEIKVGGDWRCSKQLFEELTPPEANTGKNGERTGTAPSKPSETITGSETDTIGCVVVDFGHVKDTNKKAGFLKWELALRSGDRGFIYVGYFSIGGSKFITESQGTDTEKQVSFSTVFEVAKESETWNIKQGLHWTDFLTTDTASTVRNGFGDAEITITLPNNHKWNSNGTICDLSDNGCGDRNQWEFKKYVGFWEYKTDGDKQAIDAINIEVKKNNVSHKHDIWSQNDFDFSDSTQTIHSGNPAWSNSISYVYDVKNSKWKNVNGSLGAKDYLTSIYSPWAKKKGTWMEADGVCYESNNRHLDKESEEAKRLLKFCYKSK